MQPQSGTLDMILRGLQTVATSSLVTKEIQAVKADLASAGAFAGMWFAADGTSMPVSVADTTYSDLTWIPESFSTAIVTDTYRVAPPYPMVCIVGTGARNVSSDMARHSAALDENRRGYALDEYVVDMAVFVSVPDPQAAERCAIILATALRRLVLRNPSLGGLVLLAEPEPAEPGGSGPLKGSAIVGAARCRVTVQTLAVV